MSSFVHLHNHTHYSLLDGACKIGDLVKSAVKDNMEALAITDHGNMFGVIPFYKAVKEAGLKPIIGIETYVAPQNAPVQNVENKSKSEARSYHLILLAKNYEGYKNLMKLSSYAYLKGFYYKPRINKEILKEYHEGLICLSSCIQGEIPFKIIRGDYDGARQAAIFFRDLFKDDFYLELQNHGIDEEEIARKGLLELSKELDIPVVATNDTHYLKQEHSQAEDILLCIQTGKDLDDPKRMHFTSDQNYFKSQAEMAELFKDVPEAVSTTLEIAKKCDLTITLGEHYLPGYKIPESEGDISLEEYFEKKCREGLKRRYDPVTPELEERLETELNVIKTMKFVGYFLIVMDFIEYARKQKIPVGPGRGSAAGSIVAYVLGITNIDPIRYGLIFERFLNLQRISMPDIDIDFCYERREEIIEYVRKKYGENNVTQIITFGRMNARAVIRDVGRVLKIPYSEVDKIAKMIPAQPKVTLKETYDKVEEFRKICDRDEIHRQLYENSLVLEGLARHASTHAAGVVITPDELTNYVPLYKSSHGDVTTQYEMTSLDEVGVLKMDFLGLRTLTVIDQTIRQLKDRNIDLDINLIPLDDPDTFKIFAEGNTIGIFQFESAGMREYLKKLQPTVIEDIIAMNALYRPGPMNWIDDFIDKKHGRKKIEYVHPAAEPVLKETYGIIVYQEQVIKIANVLAGFSLIEGDILRKAMGKKKEDLMKKMELKFIEGAKKYHNIPEDKSKKIFALIKDFAGYGFNKSHAACYSVVAFQTAYLKAHYPREFMAANLTSEMGNSNRIVILINECSRLGIKILPPDVNKSYYSFTVENESIRFGLGAIKNVGKSAIESIISAREEHGTFKTLYQFCTYLNLRLNNKKVLESLIQCGATDSLEGTRSQKLAILPQVLSMAQNQQQNILKGQTSIFGGEESEMELEPQLPDLKPFTKEQKLHFEKELLGVYMSGHPLEKYRDDVAAIANPEIGHINQKKSGETVRICGIITEFRTTLDRNNRKTAFFTVEDFTGSIRVIAFSSIYEAYFEVIEPEKLVVINGRIDRRDEESEPNIICSDVLLLETARSKFIKKLCLNIDVSKLTNEDITGIKEVVRKYPGKCELLFNVKENGSDLLLKSNKYAVNPVPQLVAGLREIIGENNLWFES